MLTSQSLSLAYSLVPWLASHHGGIADERLAGAGLDKAFQWQDLHPQPVE